MSDRFYFDKCQKCKYEDEFGNFGGGEAWETFTCPKCKTKFVVDVNLKEIKPKKK